MSDKQRETDYLDAAYQRQIERIALDLTDLADVVRRHAKPSKSYVDAATYVISRIHNALPNLPLALLVQSGRDMDAYRAEHADG